MVHALLCYLDRAHEEKEAEPSEQRGRLLLHVGSLAERTEEQKERVDALIAEMAYLSQQMAKLHPSFRSTSTLLSPHPSPHLRRGSALSTSAVTEEASRSFTFHASPPAMAAPVAVSSFSTVSCSSVPRKPGVATVSSSRRSEAPHPQHTQADVSTNAIDARLDRPSSLPVHPRANGARWQSLTTPRVRDVVAPRPDCSTEVNLLQPWSTNQASTVTLRPAKPAVARPKTRLVRPHHAMNPHFA